MKRVFVFVMMMLAVSCASNVEPDRLPEQDAAVSLESLARVLSRLPIGAEQIGEVYDAVSASDSQGYDEEYMMRDLILSPGSGVGASGKSGRKEVAGYSRPIRTLLREYLSSPEGKAVLPEGTKGGRDAVEEYFQALVDSGLQIYWPYSEDWDGETFPIITFDPGFGAESNYGYRISIGKDGARIVDSVYVDENVALRMPVWVVNSNDDSAFSPMDLIIRDGGKKASAPAEDEAQEILMLKSVTMLRNYDSWFSGASEFFIKCGAVNGFKATTEAELRNYTPSVTDMMVVVKRKYKGKPLELNTILVSNFTPQMENVAFILIEDDGGTITSWKCSATVKIKSKSYGFDIDIPYRDKDDIVWRGQLSNVYLHSGEEVAARLGDVIVNFEFR